MAAVEEPSNKTQTFFHGSFQGIGTSRLAVVAGGKVIPMSPVRSVTYLSGRSNKNYMVVCGVARRLVDSLERDERLAESDAGVGWEWGLTNFRVHRARLYYTHVIEFGWLLIAVMTGSVFLCALPLLIVTVACLR